MQYQTDRNNIFALNCRLIHGLDEIDGEDPNELSIKVIEEHMNQKIKPENTDRLQRLGNHNNLEKQNHNPLQ